MHPQRQKLEGGMRGLLIVCVVLLMVPCLQAKTIRCYPDSYPNIPQALALADTGDTVLATPGRYIADHDTLRVNWPENVPAIVLMSEFGPESTIIDGLNEPGEPIIHFLSPTSGPLAVIEGFTIRNGNTVEGGAIRFGLATIRGNVIVSNYAHEGGGLNDAGWVLEWNFFIENTAELRGGGFCSSGAARTFRNNTFARNTAPDGGGAWFSDGGPILNYNNIFANTLYGIKNTSNNHTFLDAKYNWWGDPSGPYNPWTNPDGKGDLVSEYVYYEPWLTVPGIGETELHPEGEAESTISLYVYPNPCFGSTRIHYSLPISGYVNVSVYDVSGRLVTTLRDGHTASGIYSEMWNAGNLPSGSYVCRVAVEGSVETEKVIVLSR